MKTRTVDFRFKSKALAVATALTFAMPSWAAFNSGSTGTDGPFNPTVNTELQVPPSGVFNFTSVNIPIGVTVTFRKNTTNTPVVILASGDVTIAGTININGKNSTDVGAAGNGNLGDDGLPGEGGPGGFGGGSGGRASDTAAGRAAGSGLGPGAGQAGGNIVSGSNFAVGGGGAGFGANGSFGWSEGSQDSIPGQKGLAYGSTLLLPLIGGSGGGGGGGGQFFSGSGGGGGGGAILIAASGTANISGSVLANGGNSGAAAGVGHGAGGGSGSGGGIRIVATTISGNGTLSAQPGSVASVTGVSGCGPLNNPCQRSGANGAVGRIRLEAENYTRTAASGPAHTFGQPGSVFVTGTPTLRITSVAGVASPATPTGSADITLPANTPNPVTVNFETTGIPVGNNVKLTVTPAYGNPVIAVSNALTGSTASGTAATSVTLPTGPSTLSAQTTYTIVAALGEAMRHYAGGETVEKVAVTAVPGQPNKYSLITVSGKSFDVPLALLAGLI